MQIKPSYFSELFMANDDTKIEYLTDTVLGFTDSHFFFNELKTNGQSCHRGKARV